MRPVVRPVLAVAVLLGLLWWSPPPAMAHTPHDNISSVSMSPDFAQDRTVFTISREYLLRSTDGGTTWHRMNRGLDNRSQLTAVRVAPSDPDVVYASTRDDGVYRSGDAGDSWRRTGSGLDDANIGRLAVSPDDTGVVLAGGPGGAAVTVDGGASWRVPDDLGDGEVTAVAFADGDSDGGGGGAMLAGASGSVSVSTDRGATWRRHEGALDGATVHAISAVPGSGGDAFVATDEGLFLATDDFATIERVDDDLDDDRVLDVHARSADDVLVSTWSAGVLESNDGGVTFALHDEGVSTTPMADDLDVPDFTGFAVEADGDGATMFLAGFDGLFRTADLGDGWEQVETQGAPNIAGIAISPDYAEDGEVAVVTYVNGLHRSADRGETWTTQNDGLTFLYDYERRSDYYARLTGVAFAPDHAESNRLFATARGYLFSATSDDQVWDQEVVEALVIPERFPPDVMLLSFSPDYAEDRTIFAGTDNGMVVRKVGDDQAVLIDDIEIEITAFEASPDLAADDTIYAATNDGLYLGTTEGAFEKVEGSPRGITSLALSPNIAEDGTVFVGTRTGLHVSQDRGRTFEDVPWTLGLRRPFVEAVVLSPTFADDGFVLVSERGHGLARSTDGGRTFERTGEDLLDRNVVLTSFYRPTGEPIVFSPDFAEDRTIFGIAEHDLFRSEDAGETWTRLTVPVAEHSMDPADEPDDLLLYPAYGDERSGHHGSGSSADDGAEPNPFSPKRVGAALLAGVVVAAALSLAGIGKGRPAAVRLAIRIGAGVATVAVVLFLLDLR